MDVREKGKWLLRVTRAVDDGFDPEHPEWLRDCLRGIYKEEPPADLAPYLRAIYRMAGEEVEECEDASGSLDTSGILDA